jgi:hypothetical protein
VLGKVTVVYVHPASATNVSFAATTDGIAAAVRDRPTTRGNCTDDPDACTITALAVETFGQLGKPALQLLNTLATTAAGNGRVGIGLLVGNDLCELGVALCGAMH